MRKPRLLAPCDPDCGFSVLYHVTSRVVEKRFIFNDRERARFLKLAKDFAVFSGFELVSWCLMSNHFHLLVRVPVQDVEAIPEEEMVRRLAHILPSKRLNLIIGRLAHAPTPGLKRAVLESFRRRIGHLPSYVKAVKQEFTQWFNHVNERVGTLWEGRYHSTMIEDTGGARAEAVGMGEIARIVAAYIDMNPVRAGAAADPAEKDWSSYAAALHGDQVALCGIRLLWGNRTDPSGKAVPPEIDPNDPSANSAPETKALTRHLTFLLRCDLASGTLPDSDSAIPADRPLSKARCLGSQKFFERVRKSSSASPA